MCAHVVLNNSYISGYHRSLEGHVWLGEWGGMFLIRHDYRLLIFILYLNIQTYMRSYNYYHIGEFHKQGSSERSPVCAQQPRTLSMAIVPGEHIRAIALARQQTNSTVKNVSEENVQETNTTDSRNDESNECAVMS